MLKKHFCGVTVIIVCLLLFSPSVLLAQNENDFDPAEGVDFEITVVGDGDVFDLQILDVDGDHITDIIYSGMLDTDLHIMFGQNGGGFEPAIAYSVGGRSISTAYLNTDNYIDIICSGMSYVYIFINNGDRTFTINSIPHENTTVGGIATGFINDDSYLDIIAAYQYIYYGDGTGNFPEIETLPSVFQTVYISDFNNDNIDDFILLKNNGESSIYLNDNNGNFTKSADFELGALALGVSIKKPFADFNHDGNADFAFVTTPIIGSGPFTSTITVGYGDGAGGISGFAYMQFLGTSYSLAIADVDRDNNLDLIASNISYNKMELFLGNNEGGFSGSYEYSFNMESYAKALATGDLDFDGNPDFVAGGYWNDGDATEGLILFLNQCEDAPVLYDPMITTGYSNVGIDIVNPLGFKLSQNYKTVAGADYWRQDIDLDNSIDERAIDYNLQNGEYEFTINPKPDAEAGSQFTTTIDIGSDEMVIFKDYDVPVDSKGRAEPLVFYYTVEDVSSMQPANGSAVDIDKPLFDWSGLVDHIPEVTSYQFEIDSYFDFRAPLVLESNLDSPQYTPTVSLTENNVYYWRFKTFDGAEWSEYSRTMAVNIVDHLCGNTNGQAGIDILDIVFIIDYKYKGGPAPEPFEYGDVDGVPGINIMDIVYLINSIYKGGP
ncbi:MAG: VCBS repeat-containing protein, partial [candidate division Zixibacteria bacterium]|nr:VCBS repeat-containing protein [candidate division Zixibacteria bacterium]